MGGPSPLGIANLGNTCYLAATLQCLLRVPTLRNYLLRQSHSKSCGAQGFCVFCELEEYVGKTRIKKHRDRTVSGPPLEPRNLVRNLASIAPHLVRGRQEDAHELLRFLVDALQKA